MDSVFQSISCEAAVLSQVKEVPLLSAFVGPGSRAPACRSCCVLLDIQTLKLVAAKGSQQLLKFNQYQNLSWGRGMPVLLTGKWRAK